MRFASSILETTTPKVLAAAVKPHVPVNSCLVTISQPPSM
jgi:hypothetical protein